MPNGPAGNRSPRPGTTRQASREVLGYLIARPDPVRGAEEATHAGTMCVPRQFMRTDMRKQPGELELFSTEELIDELMKRTTFQGVIVHARTAPRAGTGPASGSSGSASTRTSAPRRPAACSTSSASTSAGPSGAGSRLPVRRRTRAGASLRSRPRPLQRIAILHGRVGRCDRIAQPAHLAEANDVVRQDTQTCGIQRDGRPRKWPRRQPRASCSLNATSAPRPSSMR